MLFRFLILSACLFPLLALAVLLSSTTTYSTYGSSTVLLRINTLEPGKYKLRVLGEKQNWQETDKQGRIILEIPGGCVETRHIFGYQYYGPDLYRDPAIEIVRNETVIKRFSLEDIRSLKTGDDDYRELNL